MPFSKRRSARKREAETRTVSNTDAVDSSPSRPAAKKRRTNGTARPLPEIAVEENDNADNDDASSDEVKEDDDSSTDLADQVIPYLAQPNYSVVAAIEHRNKDAESNAGDTVSAFAKVAGKDWTYYVNTTEVRIGRPPDGPSKLESSPPLDNDDLMKIQIDLGPNKLVSRLHAEIFFDAEKGNWNLIVNGRNGAKINETTLKRGQRLQLTSGDVIEIAGTEMMFVTAERPAEIHQKYRARLTLPIKEEEPEIYGNQAHAHPELSSFPDPLVSTQHLSISRGFNNSQTAAAPALSTVRQPSTPIRSPTRILQSANVSGKSPAYGGRGIMMQSSEQIDYASDAVQDVKPGCSYATLIAQAILSTSEEMLTLSGIYEWIREHFSYYRNNPNSGWQNSIRHNLSLNSAFDKVPRRTDEPGKGMKWKILPDKRDEFVKNGLKLTSRGGARQSSGPNSPAARNSLTNNFTGSQAFQTSPTAHTPPVNTYPPTAQESYTPSRGSRISALGNAHGLPDLSDDASPLPARPHFQVNSAAAAGSPPTLSSSAYFDDQNPANNFYTPAPQKRDVRLPAPSTAKVPSTFLPMSSPAPYWNFGSELGSTPARGYIGQSSPAKSGIAAVPLQSSSPPPALANGSPTRIRSMTSSTAGRSAALGPQKAQIDEDEDDDAPMDMMQDAQKLGAVSKKISNAAR